MTNDAYESKVNALKGNIVDEIEESMVVDTSDVEDSLESAADAIEEARRQLGRLEEPDTSSVTDRVMDALNIFLEDLAKDRPLALTPEEKQTLADAVDRLATDAILLSNRIKDIQTLLKELGFYGPQ